jgi:hypothetical protein
VGPGCDGDVRDGIEVLEREADDLCNLAQEWGQQIQKQQDVFQQLVYGTMDTYLNFLRTWFSFYQGSSSHLVHAVCLT